MCLKPTSLCKEIDEKALGARLRPQSYQQFPKKIATNVVISHSKRMLHETTIVCPQQARLSHCSRVTIKPRESLRMRLIHLCRFDTQCYCTQCRRDIISCSLLHALHIIHEQHESPVYVRVVHACSDSCWRCACAGVQIRHELSFDLRSLFVWFNVSAANKSNYRRRKRMSGMPYRPLSLYSARLIVSLSCLSMT